MKNTEIAELFMGAHHSVIGKNVARFAGLVEENAEERKDVEEIRKRYDKITNQVEYENAKCEV